MTTGTEAGPSNAPAPKGEADTGKLAPATGFTSKGAWAAANPVSQKHKHKIRRKVRCMR